MSYEIIFWGFKDDPEMNCDISYYVPVRVKIKVTQRVFLGIYTLPPNPSSVLILSWRTDTVDVRHSFSVMTFFTAP